MDVSKAFDMVWHADSLYEMLVKQINNGLVKFGEVVPSKLSCTASDLPKE